MKSNSHLDESLEAIIQEITDVELEQVSGGSATLTVGEWGPLYEKRDLFSELSEQFKSFPNIFGEAYDPKVTNPVVKA